MQVPSESNCAEIYRAKVARSVLWKRNHRSSETALSQQHSQGGQEGSRVLCVVEWQPSHNQVVSQKLRRPFAVRRSFAIAWHLSDAGSRVRRSLGRCHAFPRESFGGAEKELTPKRRILGKGREFHLLLESNFGAGYACELSVETLPVRESDFCNISTWSM